LSGGTEEDYDRFRQKAELINLSKFRIHTDSLLDYTKLLDAFHFAAQEGVKYTDSDRPLSHYSIKGPSRSPECYSKTYLVHGNEHVQGGQVMKEDN